MQRALSAILLIVVASLAACSGNLVTRSPSAATNAEVITVYKSPT